MNIKCKPDRVLILAIVAAIICIAFVLLTYFAFLGKGNLSRDPAVWGQFGDYLGGMLNPIFALFNVVIFAYVAMTFQKINEREKKLEEQSEERINVVLDLHREWNEQSNYQSRTIAGKLVRRSPSNTVLQIEENDLAEEAVHLWIVIGFFLRLRFLIEHKKVHPEMTVELFGELFVWWWTVSFEKQLIPVDWEARDRILELKEWLFSTTTEAQRAPWTRRAAADRDVAVEQEQSRLNN